MLSRAAIAVSVSGLLLLFAVQLLVFSNRSPAKCVTGSLQARDRALEQPDPVQAAAATTASAAAASAAAASAAAASAAAASAAAASAAAASAAAASAAAASATVTTPSAAAASSTRCDSRQADARSVFAPQQSPQQPMFKAWKLRGEQGNDINVSKHVHASVLFKLPRQQLCE